MLQVRKQLWQQQAKAAARANTHSSNSGSRSPINQHTTANRPRSPSRQRWELLQQQLQHSEPLPAFAAAAAAASKRLSKTVTLPAVLAGEVDFAAAVRGWEGSRIVVELLADLYGTLLCKLALQVGDLLVLRSAAVTPLCNLPWWAGTMFLTTQYSSNGVG